MEIAPDCFRHTDTTNAWVLRRGREAILVDIGDGTVLHRLGEYGVDRVAAILMTHHHRDGAQGLARAAAAGIPIHVPPSELHLFERVDAHWQARELDNNYNLREDRFSILESVPVAGTVPEYRRARYGGFDVLTLPTPGHTPGSVSYLVDLDGRRLAFTGDLIAAPGKVWSLAATQWTYTGLEGVAATIVSGLGLLDAGAEVLLPAHGDPITDPGAAIGLLNERLQALIDLRNPAWRLQELRDRPYVRLSEHLLHNRTSIANSYVLLSDTGGALAIDFGYDFTTGLPSGVDRASRRPLLETIPALKRQFGVDRVEAAIPTHYHDDHVAGFNLLRDVEGTRVWSPANMTAIFRDPRRYDLPCLWWDPVGVDRELAFGVPVRWREYEITVHQLPGHTLYACAIEVEVDGARVVATGDQQGSQWQPGGALPEFLNYEYRNRFGIDDFRASAALYRRLRPDVVISGHWAPRPLTPDWLEALERGGEDLARLHRELLPLDEVDFDAEGFGARIEPYRSRLRAGETLELEVEVRNPFHRPAVATVAMIVPRGWDAAPGEAGLPLDAAATGRLVFRVTPAGGPIHRARVAADLTVDGRRFGQHAEALVTILP
ncbi:MAG TPA: MBL fold metallo-hydrolase [Candidatus Limnocylindrales bacterium]|nr:MBL fold metallo-hydrolase [Candidatus Limnocylindrales bacterium]